MDRNVVCLSKLDGILAASDTPFAPWGNYFQFRVQRLVGELEADLIVPLAGGTMGDGVRTFQLGDFHLTFGDKRAGHGRAQKIFPLVDRPRHHGGKNVVGEELLPQVFDVNLTGTRCKGFLFQP